MRSKVLAITFCCAGGRATLAGVVISDGRADLVGVGATDVVDVAMVALCSVRISDTHKTMARAGLSSNS